ncbi:glycosyltransferase [Phenylobacterium immobile]|uniref:glycosyltransferase n=1 Tax=Phenylobacterium immobile TaxID=21 RepID=UPI000AC08B1F|nr:glycosyltransferase [Phenylobacterium immobile]
MRIVDVAEFYAPGGGGVRTYIDRKFIAAADAGHELFVIAPGPRDGFEPRPGGGVVWVKAPGLPFDASYWMFAAAAPVHAHLDRLAPDMVEASSPWRGAWIVAKWPAARPRTMFVHADPVASYPQRLFAPHIDPDRVDRLCEPYWAYHRGLAAHFDSSVAGSAWLAKRLRDHGLSDVEAVPLGADVGAFSPALRDPGLHARLLADCGLPAHGKVLVGVGRHHPQKRWPMLMAAVDQASSTAAPLGLIIIGEGMDRARIERAARRRPHVRLMDRTRDRAALAAILASADALLHGSESETFGLVVAEALASGLPAVLPDRGACAELASPFVSELYRAGDPAAAAAAIRRLFARDQPALRAAAADAATGVRSDAAHFRDLFAFYRRRFAT